MDLTPSWDAVGGVVCRRIRENVRDKKLVEPLCLTVEQMAEICTSAADGSLTLENVAATFNTLARLEAEGYHNDQTFYVAETVWGMMTAAGHCVDMRDVESLLFSFGSLLDGLFRELTADDLKSLVAGDAKQ